MTIELKAFTPEMLPTVHEWWKAASFEPLPLELLPTLGLVVFVDAEPACAGWVYRSDSALGYLEWVVANPAVRREKRNAALNKLVESLIGAANACGVKRLFSSVQSAPLMDRLEKFGFNKTDRKMTNMVWRAN